MNLSREQLGLFCVPVVLAGALAGCGEGSDSSGEKEKGQAISLPEIEVWRGPARFVASPEPVGSVPDDADPNSLYINTYQVSPNFPARIGNNDVGELFSQGARQSPKEIFESYGITFGPGATVVTGSQSGQLVVRQTQEQMALVEAVLESLSESQQRNLHFRMEIYQMPALHALKLQQSAESEGDHRGEWEATLRLLEEGTAELVTALTLSSRSGQRCRAVDGREWIFSTGGSFETREVGTSLEVDPVVQADGEAIQVSVLVEHHTALPTRTLDAEPGEGESSSETHVFHAKKIQAEVAMGDTHAKLIGSWRPTGRLEFEENEDLMQIVFLQVDLQPLFRIDKQP